MADSTKFSNTSIAKLLSGEELKVPDFQRKYAWLEENVQELWNDLDKARKGDRDYFLGTIVLAQDVGGSGRQLIVDGQQRLTTVALLLLAIRDRLRLFDLQGHDAELASSLEQDYLRRYNRTTRSYSERLILSADDHPTYSALLGGDHAKVPIHSKLYKAYLKLQSLVDSVAPTAEDHQRLLDIDNHLSSRVQVLTAVTSDLHEAYVVFETLNDRGVTLAPADMIKNYLFSQAGTQLDSIKAGWTRIASKFKKEGDFTRFIRAELMSRVGHVTHRSLTKTVRSTIGQGPENASRYIQRLERALLVYEALSSADHDFWADSSVEVSNSILAFRRFQLEIIYPLVIAIFMTWPDKVKATKTFVKIATWSVRAMVAGKLGGGVAEKAFNEAARNISEGTLKNQEDTKRAMASILISDSEFRTHFQQQTNISASRAKYFLGMIEGVVRDQAGTESNLDISSPSITLEHVKSIASGGASNSSIVQSIGNFALLDGRVNRKLGQAPFDQKVERYAQSQYLLTKEIGKEVEWDESNIRSRASRLASLAPATWPAE
ncbi:DUF262 domain-containing protein [Leucobacter sp. W1153]|uniref:DUF262 domain-containing protein n=1 Tax=Leucobacter sp. W1153 TaxID=3439064 RepID=UPI003F32BD6C